MDTEAGRIRLKRGQAIIVPEGTVIILPVDSRTRMIELHFLKKREGKIQHITAPIDDRPRRPR